MAVEGIPSGGEGPGSGPRARGVSPGALVALLVSNVVWDDDRDPKEIAAGALGVEPAAITSARLVKKSLDSRWKKPRWQAVLKVEAEDEGQILARQVPNVRAWSARDEGRYGLSDGSPGDVVLPEKIRSGGLRPIVVGAGPAGLFAALWLAENGLPALLLDRGEAVEPRVGAVNGFWQRRRPLDSESNVLFGEGGSGTFSDGKIYTRRRDGELGFVFRRLVDFGADPAILEESLAHLGTDKVRIILPRLRARLVELGTEIRYGVRVDDLLVEGGRCVGVVTAQGEEIRGGAVFMGPGHSARDSLTMMVTRGASAEVRPISIGARIEHPQGLIDGALYGKAERGELPASSYRLTDSPKVGRAVHTFCMCPGGMVVPAFSEPGRVVVNGMSFAARRAFWANSAIIVAVEPSDYGAMDPLAGLRWQDEIERRAFEEGGGDYKAPAQRFVDLVAGQKSVELPRTSYPMGAQAADLRRVLPPAVIEGMVRAIQTFNLKIPGFAGPDAVLIAPETRTTSPIRFHRTEGQESTTLPGLFPIGEGAGFAGGIVSSALDGLRAVRAWATGSASGV